MRRRFLFLSLAALMFNTTAGQAKPRIRGGPGTSEKTAFIIEGTDSTTGVMLEYAVLEKLHPDWERQSQALVAKDGKYYDVHVILKGGETKSIYFDITDFFGK